MSTPFTVAVCGRCGHAAHPPRILCPRCGAREWRIQDAGGGVVEEATVRRRPGGEEVHLVSVRADAGPVVIARAPAGLARGDRVLLRVHGRRTTAEAA